MPVRYIHFFHLSRSSHPQKFYKTSVFKNFIKFTEKHLCWSFRPYACNFTKKRLQHSSPLNFAIILRITFSQKKFRTTGFALPRISQVKSLRSSYLMYDGLEYEPVLYQCSPSFQYLPQSFSNYWIILEYLERQASIFAKWWIRQDITHLMEMITFWYRSVSNICEKVKANVSFSAFRSVINDTRREKRCFNQFSTRIGWLLLNFFICLHNQLSSKVLMKFY